MSAETDLLQALVLRTFDEVFDTTGNVELAMLAADVVQLDGLTALGAPAGVLALIAEAIATRRAQLEAEVPELFAEPEPTGVVRVIAAAGVPGLDGLRTWLQARLDQLTAAVGAVAGAVKDAAIAAVQATLPTLAEVALSLVSTVEGSLSFIGENLAQLDDVAMALAEGVGGGLESAAGEFGNRISSAAGNALTAFWGPLESAAVLIRSGTPQVLEPGPRA